jgi:hypothetical protein
MVGGTDLSNPSVDPPPTQAAFATAYAQFLQTVRSKNPNALIVAATSPTTSNFYPTNDINGQPYMARTKMIGGIADAVAARVAAGDTKVKTFTFMPASDTELGGLPVSPDVRALPADDRRARAVHSHRARVVKDARQGHGSGGGGVHVVQATVVRREVELIAGAGHGVRDVRLARLGAERAASARPRVSCRSKSP